MAGWLFGLALGATLVEDAATMDFKTRPVSKVIKLLHDMKAELEADAANDQSVYDKLVCWCKTNEKDKTTATGTANKQIDGLLSDIGRFTGKGAQLKAEIAQAEKEKAANEKALKEATAVREKESSEFNSDEKDMLQSLQALKNAVFVLSKHHESFLQLPVTKLAEVRTAAKHALKRADNLLPSQQKALHALVQQPNANAGSYQPASSQIFGILKQMKEEFESNLSTEQKTEQQAVEDFTALKKAKEYEIDASASQIKQKTQDAADAANKLAESKENLESTREALGADKQFLEELTLRCQQTDKDFELRTKARADEIAAVSEAIAILSDDDAQENFGKTLSFVQVDQRAAQLARNRGAEVLLAASRKTGSAALTSLAVRAKAAMNPKTFQKVEGAIDDMVEELKKVQADEVVTKDKCVADLREVDKEIHLKNREIKEYTSFIEEADETVKQLEKEIEIHLVQVKEAEKQMKVASEEREAQNKEFQTAVTEQRAAQDVLKKALARLKAFYKEKSLMQQPTLVQEMGFSLIQGKQTPGAAAPPPPPGFEKFEQNKGSSGVMMLIENVIEDAEKMEKDAMTAETDAQAAYVEFITNSNAAIKGDKDAVAMKTEQKTQTIADKETSEADRNAALKDAENLYKTKADLHQMCDFLIENFDVRQQARTEEMEALSQSKQLFHGADVA
jgi:hypothetical protein